MVLMSHMHFDHATGLTDVDGNSIFSNATHFVQQDEWHEFTSPNIRSKATYWEINRGTYENKLILFDKEVEVYPGIHMKHVGGHSYGQSIITIESEERELSICLIYCLRMHILIRYGLWHMTIIQCNPFEKKKD